MDIRAMEQPDVLEEFVTMLGRDFWPQVCSCSVHSSSSSTHIIIIILLCARKQQVHVVVFILCTGAPHTVAKKKNRMLL